MALLSLHNVGIQFGGPPLLEDVSVSVEPFDRIAVTGRNGEGKSTLLKIVSGDIPPDTGSLTYQSGLTLAYLSQDVPEDRPGTAAEVAAAFPIHTFSKNRREATPRVGHRVSEYLSKLELDGNVVFNTLSGGLRRRVLLAGALAGDPQLLLLDEPTNHLDIASIEWLEKYLQKSRCACLFVTHDRSFLRHIAKRVFDLDRGRLAGWDCDYATFLQRKQDLLYDEAAFWEKKSKKLNAEEAWIRQGVKARTRRNQGRVAALEKLREEFASRRSRVGTSRLDLGCAETSGERVLKIENVSFRYPGAERFVIRDFTAKVLRRERIGIIGANGTGKTTLLRLLCGELSPTQGEIILGSGVQIAYFDQLRAQLNPDATVRENLAEGQEEVIINGQRKHVYSYLSDFLFTSDRARTPVRALSGGERARLLLARLFLTPGNLLVLDEPTNDLDVETLELLEEQIQNYAGTVLLISHDRAFLDHVATASFVLPGDGSVQIFPGGYSDWVRQRKEPEEEASEQRETAERPRAVSVRKAKLSYNEQRDRDLLPGKIEELETAVQELHDKLADPALYEKGGGAAAEIQSELDKLNQELEAAIDRWAEIEEKASLL